MASKTGPFLKILEQKTAIGKFESKISEFIYTWFIYMVQGIKVSCHPWGFIIIIFILIYKQRDFVYFICGTELWEIY